MQPHPGLQCQLKLSDPGGRGSARQLRLGPKGAPHTHLVFPASAPKAPSLPFFPLGLPGRLFQMLSSSNRFRKSSWRKQACTPSPWRASPGLPSS